MLHRPVPSNKALVLSYQVLDTRFGDAIPRGPLPSPSLWLTIAEVEAADQQLLEDTIQTAKTATFWEHRPDGVMNARAIANA